MESKKFRLFVDSPLLPSKVVDLPGMGCEAVKRRCLEFKDTLMFEGLSANKAIAIYFFLERDMEAMVNYLTHRLRIEESRARTLSRALDRKFGATF